jgi:hypothetical protein
MKILRRACIVLPSVLIVALIVFYGLWARHTSTPRILAAKDTSDIATLRGSSVQAGYDPYFNRVNLTRDIMLRPTNPGGAVSKPH